MSSQEYKFYIYDRIYPSEKDTVIVSLDEITENGIRGKCIDYPECSVFVPLTEVSRKRVNLKKYLIREKKYSMYVLAVNRYNKIIDVSNTKISEKEKQEALCKFEEYDKIKNLGTEVVDMLIKIFNQKKYQSSETEIQEIFNAIICQKIKTL